MDGREELFLWTFGHGTTGNPGSGQAGLNLADGSTHWDTDLADCLSPIECKDRVIWMAQCFSGGCIDNLSSTSTLVVTPCLISETAHVADDKDKFDNYSAGSENELHNGLPYFHSEFNFHIQNAVRWETPTGQGIDADVNGDGDISIAEAFDWMWENNSCRFDRLWRGETPQLDDPGVIAGQTYLRFPGWITRMRPD
jgi:hypothetical protein